jgi:glycosyltransferase involved in cell wall biosynthesis
MQHSKPAIAFWFRYGPAEHTELFHALPEVIEALAAHAEIHYYGFTSRRDIPPSILSHATVHRLPFVVDRTSTRNKLITLILWYLCLPWIGVASRWHRVKAVCIDETLPLEVLIARVCFGRNVAFTVADFFPEMYCGNSRLLRPLVNAIRAIDLASWRHLPLIFTRAKSTSAYLGRHAVPTEVVHPVYDPCDFTVFHPVDRQQARTRMGYTNEHLVLVHHGILHPNKGNDRILRAIARIKTEFPQLRYLLIGNGSEMASLKALAAELGIVDRVQFTGWLPSMTHVNQALNAGDIGLVMRAGQQSDNFHMTGALVHNMACGLPILAARLEGVSEVIQENDAGLLFHPDSPEEFDAKLLLMARDAPMRVRMGGRALQLAHALFDMRKVVDATARPLLKLAGIKEPLEL